MGKRSSFDKLNERDFHPTPRKAVLPLLRHLRGVRRYIEPCAGNGALIGHLRSLKKLECVYACDIQPIRLGEIIEKRDAMTLTGDDLGDADAFITNFPWTRIRKDNSGYPLIPLIEHCSSLLPTWTLLDADFMHIQLAAGVMKRCAKVVSVGRVRWIEGSDSDGKDNACWYLFNDIERRTRFVGRQTA